jgi:hypothetical protein
MRNLSFHSLTTTTVQRWALRFETSADPVESGYCHCRICQRSTGALDEPARFPPQKHIYCGSAIPWLTIADELRRFAEALPLRIPNPGGSPWHNAS